MCCGVCPEVWLLKIGGAGRVLAQHLVCQTPLSWGGAELGRCARTACRALLCGQRSLMLLPALGRSSVFALHFTEPPISAQLLAFLRVFCMTEGKVILIFFLSSVAYKQAYGFKELVAEN